MNTLFESLTGLSLLEPDLLWLALLVPAIFAYGLLQGRRTLVFAPFQFLRHPHLPRSLRQELLPLLPALRALALLLIVVALARPAERVEIPREREGIDILLCIDVSSSMAAKDMDPAATRLEIAKAAAADFVKGRPDDRIGLLRFARYTDLLCPLTLDHDALLAILAEMQQVEQDNQEDLTGIGSAVGRAAQLMRKSDAKSKVAILLTDGEENVARKDTPDEIGPLAAGLLCRDLDIRVYTIAAGIGKQDATGKFVPLDHSQMEGLADRTGGEFFEAKDKGAITSVYQRIAELETVDFAEPEYELHEYFMPFLLAAIGAYILRIVLQLSYLRVMP